MLRPFVIAFAMVLLGFEREAAVSREQEEILYEAHPAMFRSHPVSFVIAILLIAAFGIGLIVLLVWWLNCLGTHLTVTNKRIKLRQGILSKNTNEVWHTDVRNIQLRQGIMQRVFGVGRIMISSAGQSDVEIDVDGLPDPEKIQEIIDAHREE